MASTKMDSTKMDAAQSSGKSFRTFLLEIGTEELPSGPLMRAQEQLGKLFEQGLKDAGLAHGTISTLSSPRRLTVVVADLAEQTQATHQLRRGPSAKLAFNAEGKPTPAAMGFARGAGVAVDELLVQADAKGTEYVFAVLDEPAKPASPLLSSLCERSIGALSFPRSQRWGNQDVTFCRPVRWICCLFGDEIVPVSYGDVVSSNITYTHRVLGSGSALVACADDYEQVLEDGFVLGEQRRRERIREGIKQVEQKREGCRVDTPTATFDEVVNLCEWPEVLVGTFDKEFLDVPHEIIRESMLSHQRYFPINDAKGKLTREFVIVSNADPRVAETVISGNERVVRARLDDAKFFYEEDLKVPLEDFVGRLASVTFQERLGTLYDKVVRMERLASCIAKEAELDETTTDLAIRAAHLCKADLVSQAVVEFTSQQGVMGGYYALAAGEDTRVAEAIRDHYRPRFAKDSLPLDSVGCVVAVADKLDTICGMYAIDEPPTGSSDPFAVRRAAIGVISILRTMPPVDVRHLISVALDGYAAQGLEFEHDKTEKAVVNFFLGRLATIARDEHVLADIIEAVSSAGVVNPGEFIRRAHALERARSSHPALFENLAIAYRRAAHLADRSLGVNVDESLLGEAERPLFEACMRSAKQVRRALKANDYEEALEQLAALRAPIDRFFGEVLVMDKDERLRENRLKLLNRFTDIFHDVANVGALSRKK